jgi:hypothetical protein
MATPRFHEASARRPLAVINYTLDMKELSKDKVQRPRGEGGRGGVRATPELRNNGAL